MSKFIKIENIIFNVDEIQFIGREYFSSMVERYWGVKVTTKNGSGGTYKFNDEQSANEFLEQISDKLGAVEV